MNDLFILYETLEICENLWAVSFVELTPISVPIVIQINEEPRPAIAENI